MLKLSFLIFPDDFESPIAYLFTYPITYSKKKVSKLLTG